MQPPPAARPATQPGLLRAITLAEAWVEILVKKHLDGASRIALANTSADCRRCVTTVMTPPQGAQMAHIGATEPTLGEPKLNLDVLFSTASTWGAILVLGHLDGPAWPALRCTSRGCRAGVDAAVQCAAVALCAHEGLSDAALQQRVEAAARALAERGQMQRSNILTVRLPTPCEAALQALLTMAEPARQAVGSLSVQLQTYADYIGAYGVGTAWIQAVSTAFPNLRKLSLNHMSGCLPAPAQLPKLRELRVWVAVMCTRVYASIRPYLPQLTVLSISLPTDLVTIGDILYSAPTTYTLTHLSFVGSLDDELASQLCERAPNLQYVGCSTLDRQDDGQVQARTWRVRVLEVRESIKPEHAAVVPHSDAGLTVGCAKGLSILCTVYDNQGLSAAARDGLRNHMSRWSLAGPVRARLALDNWFAPAELSDLQSGIAAALLQLSGLPAQTTYNLVLRDRGPGSTGYNTQYGDASAAIQAAGPVVAQRIIIVSKDAFRIRCDDATMRTLCELQAPLAYPQVAGLSLLETTHARARPPWQRLTVAGSTALSQLPLLPDPGLRPYEICFHYIEAGAITYTDAMWAELEARLPRFKFIMPEGGVVVLPPDRYKPSQHAAALRQVLRALKQVRWCVAKGVTPEIALQDWSLTPDVVVELHALSVFSGNARFTLFNCDWQPGCTYEHMPAIVPRCYNDWVCRTDGGGMRLTAPQCISLCRGLAARGEAGRKSTLRPRVSTSKERAQVEMCVSEEGLGRWLEDIDWAYDLGR